MKLRIIAYITICTALAIIALMGCGGDESDPELDPMNIDGFPGVGNTWAMSSVNGEPLVSVIEAEELLAESESEEIIVHITQNEWVFDDMNVLTGSVGYEVETIYHDEPQLSMIVIIASTIICDYTNTHENLSITLREVGEVEVDIVFNPVDAWEKKLEEFGVQLEDARSQSIEDLHNDFSEDSEEDAVFKDSSDYKWKLEGDKLILTSPEETIIFKKKP